VLLCPFWSQQRLFVFVLFVFFLRKTVSSFVRTPEGHATTRSANIVSPLSPFVFTTTPPRRSGPFLFFQLCEQVPVSVLNRVEVETLPSEIPLSSHRRPNGKLPPSPVSTRFPCPEKKKENTRPFLLFLEKTGQIDRIPTQNRDVERAFVCFSAGQKGLFPPFFLFFLLFLLSGASPDSLHRKRFEARIKTPAVSTAKCFGTFPSSPPKVFFFQRRQAPD
jgi:hypothetical protein